MIALKRFGLILFAYFLAASATGIVVAACHILLPSYVARLESSKLMEFLSLCWALTFMVSFFASSFALIVMAVGEWFSIRNPFYYSLSGAAIGLFLAYTFLQESWFPYVGVAQGLVAGAIYWRVAGQRAGDNHWICAVLAVAAAVFMIVHAPLFFGVPQWLS